jgi:hypothetical protein
MFGTDCTMASLKLRLRSWAEGRGKRESGVQYNIDRAMRYQAILSALRLFKLSTSVCPYLTVCVENTRLKGVAKNPVKCQCWYHITHNRNLVFIRRMLAALGRTPG